jgi:hypothetical protein
MPKKLQSDDDKLMEIFQRHYAELRREHNAPELTGVMTESIIAKILTGIPPLLAVHFSHP